MTLKIHVNLNLTVTGASENTGVALQEGPRDLPSVPSVGAHGEDSAGSLEFPFSHR